MPPRSALVTRLSLRHGNPPSFPFVCPECLTWRVNGPASKIRRHTNSQLQAPSYSRSSSTLASSTAINPPIEIPPQFQDLRKALQRLKHEASSYINLSRLQLALRGLETSEPVIRVAFLGLDEEASARKLARILLADPLAAESGWEKTVETLGIEDARGLLIRYGDEEGTIQPNPLIPTISVPSHTLRNHHIEILIATLSTNLPGVVGDAAQTKDAMLVPAVDTPTSTTGRVSVIRHPVHKALVFGQGVRSCVAYGRLTAGMHEDDAASDMIKVALGLPAPGTVAEQEPLDTFAVVDVELALKALGKFRESIANATAFEHGWFKSGMPTLSDWLTRGTKASNQSLKPALTNLISSVLDEASQNMTMEASQRLEERVSRSIPESTRQTLATSLRRWAEQAHSELRDQLDIAFTGKHWRKLAWWKLLFRVDDVTMILTEVLERRWLVEAEKGIIYLNGRVAEAGLVPRSRTVSASPSVQDGDIEPSFGVPSSWMDHTRGEPNADDGGVLAPTPRPWLSAIPVVRHRLMITTIPALQSLAQTLVLQTLSTISLTSALAALVYVSTPLGTGTSLYEAGAIASLGAVWALRRLQTKWEAARSFWEGEVREEGRKALKRTEEVVGGIASEGGKELRPDGMDDLEAATAAVQAAREGLTRVR